MEYECLARFHLHDNIHDLQAALQAETTLVIDEDDLKNLLLFLKRYGFIGGQSQDKPPPRAHWLKQLLYGYLFFTIPLFRPQKFLEKIVPLTVPLFSGIFLLICAFIFVSAAFLTLSRFDEFTHTFIRLWSFEGLMITAITFFAIKVIHEFSHAITATRLGVDVPHMGLAFMVLYPMLYTETTGAWHLKSLTDRMKIGLAGVGAELVIAAFALALWHIAPPASLLQSLAFSAVAISLVGSLLINLNPLMRFDGYYVLSDALGIENLHQRATDFARWHLRRILFGWNDAQPERAEIARARFLIYFGYAVIIYRFFLFIGIALLVYHLFFKPLGFILMVVEIYAFIFMPLLSELKLWHKRKGEILNFRRGKITAIIAAGFLLFISVPWQSSITAPAMRHAGQYKEFFAVAPAQIMMIEPLQNGMAVKTGDVLARLESPVLARDLTLSTLKLENLEILRRRSQTNLNLRDKKAEIDAALAKIKVEHQTLKENAAQLVITAPFDGVLADVNPDLHEARFISPQEPLFTIIDPTSQKITAFIGESQIDKINRDSAPVFISGSRFFDQQRDNHLTWERLETIAVEYLEWPALASIYGGPIAAEIFKDPVLGESLTPRTWQYRAVFAQSSPAGNAIQSAEMGHVIIHAQSSSILGGVIQQSIALIRAEAGLN